MSEETITPNSLPPSWMLTTLGELIDYGKTEKVEPSEIPGDAWVLELEDIEKDSSRILQRFTQSQRQSRSTKNRFNAGDVLYGKLRPYLNKVVIADQPGFCTTEILPLQASPALDNRYLFHWLKHPAFLKYVEAASHGMNMPRLGTEAGKSAPLVVAPRSEQTRIADQLDTLLARIQTCQDHLNAIPALLKRFRQAVLNNAVKENQTETESQSNESPWVDTTIGAIAVDLRYGTSKRCSYSSTGYGVLRIPNIGAHGRLDISDLKRADFDAKEIQKLALQDGDLLVIRSNGSTDLVGKVSLVTQKEVGLLFAGYLMRLRVDSNKVRPAFVRLWLAASAQRRLIEQTAKSTSGVNNLNSEELRSLPLRLPSLEEQDKIIRRTDVLFNLADLIEARYAAAFVQSQRLTPLTLAKAFRGELVQQNPDDVPASVLLQRLAKTSIAMVNAPRDQPQNKKLDVRPTQPDLAGLPSGIWAVGAPIDEHTTTALVIAVLKAWGRPTPQDQARLAAMLCLQPRLLTAAFPSDHAVQWRRLVGAEAERLPASVPSMQPTINTHWRRALAGMRGRGDLIESGPTPQDTWTLGPGATQVDTSGWPDGRAGWVVAYLQTHGIDAVLPSLSLFPEALEFVHACAA